MAGTLGSLVVDIGADVARLRQDMGKATKTVGSATKRIESLAKQASSKLKGIGGALAVAFSVRGFSRFLTETADATDKVGKLSQRLGITTEAVSRLQFVASQSGISFETMRGSLERLGKRASLAANGQQEFAKAFELVGLNAEKFVNLPLDEQLLIVADAVNKAQGSSQKLAAVSKILGDESRALVQAFGDGAEGIKKLNDRADELGITVSALQAKISAEFNNSWGEANRVMAAAGREIATVILPAVQKMADLIRDVGVPAVKALSNAFELLTGDKVKETEQNLGRVERRLDALRGQRDRVADIQKTRREGLLGDFVDPEEQKAELDKHDANIKRLEGIRKRIIDAEKDKPKPPPAPPPRGRPDKEAEKRAKKAAQELAALETQARRTIDTLDTQQLTLGFTAEQMTVYQASVLAAKLQNEDLANQLVATAESATQATIEFEKQQKIREDIEEAEKRAAEEQTGLEEQAQRTIEALESQRITLGLTSEDLTIYEARLLAAKLENEELAQQLISTAEKTTKAEIEFEKIAKKADEVDKAWSDVGDTIESAFGAAVAEGAKLSDVLKGLGEDLLKLASQEFSKEGGLGKQLQGLFGGTGGPFDFLTSFFGGGKAVGGSVRAGKFYAVGERGPELFAPGVSGQIIPNDNMPGGQSVNNFGITINGVGDRVDTESASQFATRIAQDLQRQLRRNT